MTNAMNVLIKDSKSQKEQEVLKNCEMKEETARTQTQVPWFPIFLMLLFLQFFIILPLLEEPNCDNLRDSWRQGGSKTNLYAAQQYTPEQLHLSLGANPGEVYVTWSTMKSAKCYLIYTILYDGTPSVDSMVADGIRSIRTILEQDKKWIKITGKSSRRIISYRAKMNNLIPENRYIYRTECVALVKDIFTPVSIAFYGDLGLINAQSVPRLTRDVDEEMYDMIIHNGDFAYDMNTHLGQYGDEFMRKIEPIAARVPYQTSVGNHEIAENFTHYDHRFTMVNSGGTDVGSLNNFFYSFNAGPIHFVAISTEFYYFLDSVGLVPLDNQYKWLKQDLSHASSPSERAKRPWIVVFGHRPMYCSSRDRDDCTKESNILRKGPPFLGSYALEKLFYEHGVDVQLYSHEHQYERFLPLYDGVVYNGTDDAQDPYFNPKAPVHLISGSAGCQERLDPFKNRTAPGSIIQISDYGYTRMSATRCSIQFEQFSDDQSKVVDLFTITKTKQNFPLSSNETFDCTPKPPKLCGSSGSNQWSCLSDEYFSLFT